VYVKLKKLKVTFTISFDVDVDNIDDAVSEGKRLLASNLSDLLQLVIPDIFTIMVEGEE